MQDVAREDWQQRGRAPEQYRKQVQRDRAQQDGARADEATTFRDSRSILLWSVSVPGAPRRGKRRHAVPAKKKLASEPRRPPGRERRETAKRRSNETAIWKTDELHAMARGSVCEETRNGSSDCEAVPQIPARRRKRPARHRMARPSERLSNMQCEEKTAASACTMTTERKHGVVETVRDVARRKVRTNIGTNWQRPTRPSDRGSRVIVDPQPIATDCTSIAAGKKTGRQEKRKGRDGDRTDSAETSSARAPIPRAKCSRDRSRMPDRHGRCRAAAPRFAEPAATAWEALST